MKDENGNLMLFKEHFCKFCGEERKFMNVGQSREEFICSHCKCKTDFGKHKLIQDRFGTYFIDNEENSLELRERIVEKITKDGYLYSEFRKFLSEKNLEVEIVLYEISNPENLINLYKEFKKKKEKREIEKEVDLKELEEQEKNEKEILEIKNIIPLTKEEKKNIKVVSMSDLLKEVE